MGGDAEQSLVKRVQALGWQVKGVEHRHVDLEIVARAGSRSVRLAGYSPFSTVGVANAVADPSCFTLRVGEPGRPRLWGGWHETANLGQTSIGIQCVLSDEGMIVAAGIANVGANNVSAADQLFDAVGKLLLRGTESDNPTAETWPEIELSKSFRNWPSPVDKTLRRAGQAVFLVGGVGLAVAAVASGMPLAAPYPLIVGVGGATAIGFDWSRGVAAEPKRAAIATYKRLRTLALFDKVSEPQVLDVARLPLIRASSGLRYDGVGMLVRIGFDASSAAHGLTLRRCACSLVWPTDALAACQVLPSTWSVIEARGPEATLDVFPMHDRMDREEGRLLWLLDEHETNGEVFWQVLEEVERSLRSGTGSPYR